MSGNREVNVKFIVINGYLHKCQTGGKPVTLSQIAEMAGCKPGASVSRRLDDTVYEDYDDGLGNLDPPDTIVEVEDGYEFKVSEFGRDHGKTLFQRGKQSDEEGYIGDELVYGRLDACCRNDKYMVVNLENGRLAFHWSEDFDYEYFQEMFLRAREHAARSAYESANVIWILNHDGSISIDRQIDSDSDNSQDIVEQIVQEKANKTANS